MIKFGLIMAAIFFAIPGEWTGMFTLTGVVIALAGCVRWYLHERRVILAEDRQRKIRLLELQDEAYDRIIGMTERIPTRRRPRWG